MPKKASRSADIMGAIIGGSTIVIALLIIFSLSRYISSLNEPVVPDTVKTPPIELPDSASGTEVTLTNTPLLTKAYTVPQNPFDKTVYDNLFPKIAVRGSFEQIILNIKGKVGSSNTFLILNVGVQGGIVRAVRESPNRLNIPQTLDKGGMFKAGSTIDISVNLLKDQLGTTGTEFIKTNIGEREFNFVQANQRADVLPIVVIPFTNNGGYGGATIGKLDISYLCKDGKDSCDLAVCDNDEKTTECLTNKLDEEATKDWCGRTQLCN